MQNAYHIDNNFISNPLKLGDTYLVQLGRLYASDAPPATPHMHLNWYELTIVTDGEGFVGTMDTELPVKAGDVYVSFPADIHSIRSSVTNPLKYDFISFYTEKAEFKDALEHIHAAYIDPAVRVFSDDRIGNVVTRAMQELTGAEMPYREEILSSLLTEIIVYLIRDLGDKREYPSPVNADSRDILCYQIMNYIDTHIFRISKVSDVAEAMNYNYSYISTLFKRTTGRTVSDYYRNARLKAARVLIEEKKMKVSEISELLNYSSIYVFSRAFKRQFGYSPTDRKELL